MPTSSNPRAVPGHNSGDETTFRDGSAKIDGRALETVRRLFRTTKEARKDISLQEREAMKALINSSGLMKETVRLALRLDSMEPDDREELLAQLDVIVTFWGFGGVAVTNPEL